MKKRGTLHLATETIVVVILAIVFLGLFLAFMRYTYMEMTTDVEEIFDSLTKERIDKLKQSDKAFDLEMYTLTISPGEKKIMFMLLRNKEEEDITWDIDHSTTSLTDKINCNDIVLSYKEDVEVLVEKVRTPPLVVEVDENIDKGTCLFEIQAEQEDSEDNIETLELTVNVI